MGGVLEICSAGMWPTKRGEGASPSHLSCISPLIQQQPLNLIFQHFSPWALCSVFSCGMCCRTQLIVKTFNLWSCFSLPLPFFSPPNSSNYHWKITQSRGVSSVRPTSQQGPRSGGQKQMAWKLLSVCVMKCSSQNEEGVMEVITIHLMTCIFLNFPFLFLQVELTPCSLFPLNSVIFFQKYLLASNLSLP